MAEFDPFNKGALYDKHSDRWDLEQDIVEPTLDILSSGKHLDRFSKKEQKDDYDYRTKMSAPLDMCQDAVRIRIDNIFREEPARTFDASPFKQLIEPLVADPIRGGLTLTDLMRRVAWHYYTTGADIVAQTSAADGQEIVTAHDAKQAGIRPYFLVFPVLDRYDWACDGSGNFVWARYCLGQVAPETEEYDSSTTVTDFLSLIKNEWRIYRVTQKGDPKQQEVELLREGSSQYGAPPIVKCYFAESQKSGQWGVPISLVTRPAVIARVAMNLKSQADADLLAAVPRWFMTGRQDPPDEFGPFTMAVTNDPESKMEVVQGNVGHITEKREWLSLYIDEMLRLLKFRGGMGEVEGNQGSGVKLALEMTDLQNELHATAGYFERVELEMMRVAVCEATGKEIRPEDAQDALKYEVQYNRDFVLEPVQQILDHIERYAKKCGTVAEEVPTIAKELLRQLSRAITRQGSETSGEIEEEIEKVTVAGAGMSEPEPAGGVLAGGVDGTED